MTTEEPKRTRKQFWYNKETDEWEFVDEVIENIVIEIPKEKIRFTFYGDGRKTKREKIKKNKNRKPELDPVTDRMR